MADSKQFETPPGIAVYPRLKTPDTKFDDLGIYKADLAVPKADAKPLMDELTALYKAHVGKAPKASENTMWETQTDEAGEETGNIIFKLRVKNKIRKKDGALWDRRPVQFDAAGNDIDVNPWGGSQMIVVFEAYEWDAGGKKGVSLQPLAVQILELVEGEGKSASAFGLKARDGYTSNKDEEDSDDDEDQDTGESDDLDDDDGDY